MKKQIIGNVSQHVASPEQVLNGVVEPQNKEKFNELLTFENLPSTNELDKRAQKIMTLVCEEGWSMIMVGCAPFFASALERAAELKKISMMYSFSNRVSEEKILADGSVKKINFFSHKGFIKAYNISFYGL